MIIGRSPLLVFPEDTPYPADRNSVEPDKRAVYGHHRPLCDFDEQSVAEHSALCRSRMAYFERLPDPKGELHTVLIERVSQYQHGVYDADELRIKDDPHTYIRVGIDLPEDVTKDQFQGLVLSSADARQIAAVLVAEADRADGIRPNT